MTDFIKISNLESLQNLVELQNILIKICDVSHNVQDAWDSIIWENDSYGMKYTTTITYEQKEKIDNALTLLIGKRIPTLADAGAKLD